MVQREAATLDAVFRALGDATRRSMLCALAAGPRKITDLAAPFDISLTAVSKHVRVLEAAGLVRRSVEGRSHICQLEAAPLGVATQWLHSCETMWRAALDARDERLRRQDDVAIRAAKQTHKRTKKGSRP
jgi:DNA-binding transcriptional ArsR family regulator